MNGVVSAQRHFTATHCGGKVGLAASNEDAYVLARDALMLLLDESGGRA